MKDMQVNAGMVHLEFTVVITNKSFSWTPREDCRSRIASWIAIQHPAACEVTLPRRMLQGIMIGSSIGESNHAISLAVFASTFQH